MSAVGSVDQLRGDAHSVAGLANAALDSKLDAELSANVGHTRRFALVDEGRSPRDDEETGYFTQIRDDVFGDPVAEIVLLRVFAHVLERQHRDRRTVEQPRCRPGVNIAFRRFSVRKRGGLLILRSHRAAAAGRNEPPQGTLLHHHAAHDDCGPEGDENEPQVDARQPFGLEHWKKAKQPGGPLLRGKASGGNNDSGYDPPEDWPADGAENLPRSIHGIVGSLADHVGRRHPALHLICAVNFWRRICPRRGKIKMSRRPSRRERIRFQ
jgi:hypothetical protein